VGAASGGRLTFSLVALAVLMASGATGVVVIGTGQGPAAGGSRTTTKMVGSSDQQPDTRQTATSAARPSPASSAAPGSAAAGGGTADTAAPSPAGLVDRYNVGAAHSPELLRELAGPLTATGVASGTLTEGVDVAAAQHPDGAAIDWPQVAAAGYTFAGVKATEGDYYANPYYAGDVAGAQAAGLRVTGYHVAIPNVSGGGAQAGYAVSRLGTTAGGQPRPLALDVEYDPYTATDHSNQCYGLTAAQLVSWISAFTTEAKRLTGQTPLVYTTASWWSACTGDSTAFSTGPLWVAGYGPGQPAGPAAWRSWAYWQFTSAGTVPGIAATGATDVSYASPRRTSPFTPAAVSRATSPSPSASASG
jgi:GH25 family lysozyme M1 (1,4-beta-N-acetylmuramidase)